MSVGKITGFNRIHGFAVANDLHRRFISDGAANEVVVFDTRSNSEIQRVKVGTNPDGIVYDVPSNRVVAFNGRGQDATAIDAATGKVVGTIGLGGKPEFPVSDEKGNLYVTPPTGDCFRCVQIRKWLLSLPMRVRSLSPCRFDNGPDAAVFDAANGLIFSSNGQGATITVVKEESPN